MKVYPKCIEKCIEISHIGKSMCFGLGNSQELRYEFRYELTCQALWNSTLLLF